MSSLTVSIAPEAIRDAVAAVFWLLTNVILLGAAWRWARRLLPQDSYLDLVGHTIILSWGAIVAVATVLGGVGILTAPVLLSSVVVVSTMALVVGRARPGNAPPGPPPVDRAEKWWLGLWAVLGGFWVGHVITHGLSEFPDDWDSLAYHIPLVDQWLQAHSLWATDCNRWANPGNNELLALWAVAPFSGDFLVALNNLPAAVLLGCGGVAFATQVGLPRALAHLAGFALVCHFVLLKQLVDQENDIAVAACFFAALAYAFRSQATPRAGPLVLGAVSLGLLAGVKYYALGYAALVLAIWVGLAVATRGRRAAVQVLAAGIIGLLVFSGFWYIRNWLATGTPLYSKGLTPATDLVTRIYPEISQTSFFGNRRPELLELYIQAIWKYTGPCQWIAFLMVPVSVSWLLGSAAWTAFRRAEWTEARVRVALALLVIGTGLLLGVTPVAVEDQPGTLNQVRWGYCPVRYGSCFLGTAIVAALVVLRDFIGWSRIRGERKDRSTHGSRQNWRAGLRILVGSVLGGAILFQIPWADHKLNMQWLDTILIMANLMLISLLAVFAKLRRIWSWLALAAMMPLWGWTCASLSEQWHRGFVPHYSDRSPYDGLQDYASGETPRCALMLQFRCYPYFGSRREHRIYQPVYLPSPEWVMNFIQTEGINIVVTEEEMSLGIRRRYAAFEECLDQYPERFHQLDTGRRVVLLEVVPKMVGAPGTSKGE